MGAVVEPVLTEEKLRSLLAEGGEQDCLDFQDDLGPVRSNTAAWRVATLRSDLDLRLTLPTCA